MTQRYKAVYFADYPAESSSQKSVTIAFGKRSSDLFEQLKDCSSEEIRQLLGVESYHELVKLATDQDMTLNNYCTRQLHASLAVFKEKAHQLPLFEVGAEPFIFDPVTVTFKGGAKDPFVRWYPYLEGYSPQFVEAILTKYAPDADVILDPFAGTGTTAFTASKLNKTAYFCEINPVLQFIAAAKIHVRQLDSKVRLRLAEVLAKLYHGLDDMVANCRIDRHLDSSYHQVFGESQYFDSSQYELILKTRTLLDKIAFENQLAAELMTVAALSSLVPASRMTRAGDLRYKTDVELKQDSVTFSAAVKQRLFDMIGDMRDDVHSLKTAPILICESAHSLLALPLLGIDAIITSPPYVNGTNYFRNTKIELWFLRCLNHKADLAKYRAAALTAGINDVTVGNSAFCPNADVQRVVHELARHAYDVRIPRMISSYFAELTSIFDAVRTHLKPNAKIIIDIGDSAYNGVHVPVDELLVSCLHEIGFTQRDSVLLRQRRSRGGMLLKQVLLVFDYRAKGKRLPISPPSTTWETEWDRFKTTLPHQKVPFAKRNWGHGRHSLCSYMGKLKPAIAHHLVATFVPPGGRVLDPFAGVGTIPFEAALQGKPSFGFDISPAAFAIANAKVQSPSPVLCEELIHRIESFVAENRTTNEERYEAKEFGFNGKIADYYEQSTLGEILLARRFFQLHPPESTESCFVLASLLHILHGNRPYSVSRRSHPLTPYKPTGEFEYKSLIKHLKDKVRRSLEDDLPSDFVTGRIYLQDSARWWPLEVDQLDAVITSPPFFDSTRFYLANWLRLWFVGWSPQDFATQPLGFIDERQKQSFDVYIPVLRQARERLKPGGVVVLHLGKSEKCDMATELLRLGKRWFKSYERFDESVDHCESHGIRDKGTVTSHQYLVLY
jgi:tRNA G10  N-methylase Trm11